MRTEIRPEDWAKTTLALRHLATQLVVNREQREDLVQGALVAAIEHPPRRLSWSWFARVLQNSARDLVRSRQRRGGTEQLPLLQSTTLDAAEIAQRLELQEELTRALRALDEPYQSTLYLRFFEDLAPTEIARRTGVPVKTVKTRLERGLERLRQRLEPRHGHGLRALLPLLTPMGSGLRASIALAPATGGLLLMWKKMALVAVVLLAGLVWWRAVRSDGIEAGATVPSDALAVAPATAHNDSSNLATPDREHAGERNSAPAPAATKPPTARFGSVIVQVHWSDGTPAPGVAVNFRGKISGENSARRGLVRATSDDEGRARSGEMLPGAAFVSTGRGMEKSVDVVAGEEREVVLDFKDGLQVDGRVVDAHDRPLADAEIWLTSSYVDWLGMSSVARSDSNGGFHLRDVPKDQSLGAIAQGFSPSKLVDLETLEARDGRVEVTLQVLDPGGALRGRVSDERGAPVEGANVAVGIGRYCDFRADGTFVEHWAPRQARTDVEGRFRFDGLPAASIPVAVWCATAPEWSGKVEVRAGATAELAVVLRDGASIAGIVRDAQGAPVEGAIVRAYQQALEPNFILMGQYDDPSVFGSPVAITDAQGRYSLEAIWPGEVHAYASPPRKESRFGAEFHAEALLHPVLGQRTVWDPVLEPGRKIRGHTRYSDGELMTQVFVTAVEEGATERRTLNTGEDGLFEFFNLPPGPFRIDVQLNSAPKNSAPLFKTGVYPADADLDLVADFPSPEKNPSAIVRGRFSDPLGRFPRPLAPTLDTGSGTSYFPHRTDGAAFEFRGMAAGRYRLVGSFGERQGFVGAEFELQRGEELDLGTLEVGPGATLTIRLRRAAGLEGVKIGGYLHPRETMGGIGLDFSHSDEVVLASMNMGSYELRLDNGTTAADVLRSFELAGDLLLELPIRACAVCTVQLEFASEAARGDLHMTIQGADGEVFEDSTWFRGWNEVSPHQRQFSLPVGRFTVEARTSAGFSASGELEVKAAGSAVETLRLTLH